MGLPFPTRVEGTNLAHLAAEQALVRSRNLLFFKIPGRVLPGTMDMNGVRSEINQYTYARYRTRW
jgi:hypothetical protein